MVECRYKGGCIVIKHGTNLNFCYSCDGDGSKGCDWYEPMPDRSALLKIADELQTELDACTDAHEIVGNLQYQIDRIREALGVRF